jgi:hypothetical protein
MDTNRFADHAFQISLQAGLPTTFVDRRVRFFIAPLRVCNPFSSGNRRSE